MGMFSNILARLGLGDKKANAAPAPQAPTPQAPAAPTSTPVSRPAPTPAPAPGTPPPTPVASTAPKPISEVDVVAKLEKLASDNAEKLNWKVSIVDLLKLLDLDSSQAARKELATELGAPADKMGDSAQMNMWLHKTVLRKLAENGGNIPKELL
ncbi:MAG: DUF3597 domain-containing protein [Thiobacillus sp.]